MPSSLLKFHPLIQRWFSHNYPQPTDIQDRSWSKIANGQHVLITAPTGSGKTLTAFLWSINQLLTGAWPSGRTSVLYISPLKALNNDIRRNLEQPLAEIQQLFSEAGEPFPAIRVLTRSGDTPQSDRRRMVRHPPEILITTPESLNLLLSSQSGREILTSLATVILDEIHAVVGEKRGVHLITAVDRLVRLSGEFQRVALSATIKPLEPVARFIGGYRLIGDPRHPQFEPRPVEIVQSDIKKEYRIAIRFPAAEIRQDAEDPLWNSLAEEFKEIVLANRSTLLFANSRKLSEKLAYKINNAAKQIVAYAHHGSLSREIREEVESKLKNGELKAIVATSSLEMGIDIGSLDEVVLIQSPFSVSSAIQRIGRAGHQVGEISNGTIFPSHAQDFISAAVLAEAIDQQDIEAIDLIHNPLDILSQILISMVCVESWDIDELFGWLRTSFSYHQLSREQFDLVLNMLAGRYADSRIRELKPRISLDRLDNTVEGKKGALLAVFMAGGTIPDRGYFQLRHQETGARIGELDEEYVWEARIGQLATIGTQNWRIQRITHNDVFASPVSSSLMGTPFWKSEEYGRDFHFSQRISTFLESANQRLNDPEFRAELGTRFHMNPAAVRELIGFLKKQQEETVAELPHRHHILLEYVRSGPQGAPGSQLVLHTLWGGKVNRPFAMALDAAWEENFGERLEIFPGNDCVALQLAHPIKPAEILTLVKSNTVETLLRQRLEGSGFFGARFRECAGRALLITRNKMNQRLPLWMSRLRSQKLLEGILKYDDFPILLETWRTCLQDEFDLASLKRMLDEVETGAISWTVTHTDRPSPFANGLTWNQLNKYMYQVDQPASTASALKSSLLRDVVFTPDLRPTVPGEIVKRFENKRQRLTPGYAPLSVRELVDWVKERIVIPMPEWELLLQAIRRDGGQDEAIQTAVDKLVLIQSEQTAEPLIGALEFLPRLLAGFYPGNDTVSIKGFDGRVFAPVWEITADEEQSVALLGEWLQFYGPKPKAFITSTLGLGVTVLDTIVEDLIESQTIITGHLVTEGGAADLCDSENFEILLRLNRAEARPAFQALTIEQLPLFLAQIQGLANPAATTGDFFQRLEQLVCLPCPAEAWETEIFPARIVSYQTSLLDSIMQEGDLTWLGSNKQKVAFCFQPDLDLMQQNGLPAENPESDNANRETAGSLKRLLMGRDGRYNFVSLQQLSKLSSSDLTQIIWQDVWNGILTNDGLAALRKGIEHKFQFKLNLESEPVHRRRERRSLGRKGFAQWKGSLPYAGNWFLLPKVEPAADLLEKEELNKDRVRLLLDRYGILFRELLLKEAPEFSWRAVFRSLRLMELSGEVLAGYFFEQLPGPQFISHQAFRSLQAGLSDDAVYWMNAADPASLCGIAVEALKAILPKRLPSTHLVFRGNKLVLISERNGKNLTIHTEPDDKQLPEFLAPFRHQLYRQFMPLKQVVIETINGEAATRSPFLAAFKTAYEVLVEPKKVTLYRKL
jgi:ATP-dependent Lhr-like helicase